MHDLHVGMCSVTSGSSTGKHIITHIDIPIRAFRGTPSVCRIGSQSFTRAFPKAPGLGFAFVSRHDPLDVTPSTSKAQPSMHRANKPGYIAGALPLPSAGVAVASTTVQMAFTLILE